MTFTSGMCWKLIARKVQTAIWIKQEDQSCLLGNAEKNLINICDSVDDSKPSWKTPLRNCVGSAESGYQKLPPRPQRLSEYSESLSTIGLSKLLFLSSALFWTSTKKKLYTSVFKFLTTYDIYLVVSSY